ncbi:Hemolysin, chromosomal [Anatilimnocola aggregata]|uniref:Hemolysin, chromosomal n=1 Tax=Anatilimnocola aggregata TaxID=2528021 RepID=A0A517YHV1_9BACT|nr:autotransporter-associated beta strand repeat-containing protein [Anatilimnocola aggregata]QDU29791.1 Hemolysin, chromosomal [Anatilimnocola aggregata]
MTHSTHDGHARSGQNKRTNVWKKVTGPRRRRMFLEQLEERSLLAQMIWDGGAGNDLWTTAANWQNDIAPTSGDDLVFTSLGAGPSINDFPAGTRFSTISISGSGYTFTEAATNPIELIGGLVSSHTTGTNNWNIDVTLLNAVSVFNATPGTTLAIGGDINTANVLGSTGVGVGGTSALTFDGNGDINVSGNITGAGGLAKIGSGRTTLSGANTFEGIVSIRQGYLRAASPTALGTSDGFTDLGAGDANGGMALELAGVNIVGEALAIREGGVGYGNVFDTDGLGALRAVSGASTWSGNIQLTGADNLIGVVTGATLDISGQVAAGIGGAVDLFKVGGGTLRLSGASANIYTGQTHVLQGTLELGKTAGVNAIGGDLVIGTNFNGDVGDDKAVVRLLADNQIPRVDFFNAALRTVTINPSGLLDLGVFDDDIGNLIMQTGPSASADVTGTAASLLSLGGNLTLTGLLQGTSGASPAATISANVNLGPLFSGASGHVERTITVNDTQLTDVGADLIISGVISGPADIQMVKAGGGTLRLTGNNTYLGGTVINGGITEIGHDNAFGATTSPLSFVSGQLSAFGAARNVDNPFSYESANGLDILGANAIEFSGLTTFANGNKTIGVMHPAGVVEFSGGIEQWIFGNINLAKRGLGELVFSAPATYGGTTTINDNDGGTIRLVDGGTLPFTSGITVGLNGRLVLDNTAVTVDRLSDNTNLSVSGTLVLIGETNAATTETVGVINNANDRTTTIDIRNTGTGSAQLIARRFDGAGVLSMYNFVSNDGPLDPAGSNRVTMIEAPAGNFALVGGIVPTSVATTSAGAIDFVTVQSVAEGFDVIPLPATGYTTSLANAGALSNVRVSTSEALDVAKTVNAILIDPGVSVTGAHTLTTTSGAIVFNGTGSDISGLTLSPTNARIFVEDGATATINSRIVGTANIGKSGPGTLVLTGDNTYSGNTIVAQGVLNIQRSTALGSNNGTTTVNEGARIELEQTTFGPINVSIESLALRGTGPDGLGVLRNIAGDNSWAGAITMSGSVLDQSVTTGGVSQTANVIRTTNIVDIADGSLDVSGVFGSNNNDFIKLGTGALELSGIAAGLLNQISIIAEGKLLLNKVPGISPLTGTIFVGNGVGGNDSAELELAGSDQIPDSSAITVYGDGLFDLNSNSDVTAGINLVIGAASAGDINIGAGTLTPNGDLTVLTQGSGNATGATITGGTYAGVIFGSINATAATRIWQVNDGSSGNDLTVTSTIADGSGLQSMALTKRGLGALVLGGTAANTFTGTTTVEEGKLLLAKTAGLNAIGGALTIGINNSNWGYADSREVELAASNQIPDYLALVTLNSNALLDLNGFDETIGVADAQNALSITSGHVTTGAGTLGINGNIATVSGQAVGFFTMIAPPVIEGNIDLGGISRVIDIAGDRGQLPYEAIISANISGSGGLIKNNSGHLLLSGANTYSGDTYLNNATNGIAVGHNTALGTGRVYTLSGAAFSTYGGSRTLANDLFLLAGTLNIGNTLQGGGGGDLTFTGKANVVAGALTINVNGPYSVEFAGGLGETMSGASLTKDGFGTMVISDTATLSGSLVINPQGGAIILRDEGTLLNISNATIANSFTIGLNGTLQIDNSGTVALDNRIGNTSGLLLQGGTLALVGRAGAATSEILGTITLNTNFSSQVEQLVPTAAGTSAKLSSMSLVRAAGGSGAFFGRGRALGEATGNEIVFVAALPGLTNGVFPQAVINNLTTGTPALDGMQFLHSKGPGTAIRPLEAADGLSTDINTAAATNSVRITSDVALTGNRSVNAVMIVGTGVDVTGAFNLTLTGGPLAVSGATNTIAVSGATGLGLPADATIYASSDVNISSIISGGATTNKSGPGTVTSSGAGANTFAGTALNITDGVWVGTKATAFGAAAGAVNVLTGATLAIDGAFSTVTKTGTLTINGTGEGRAAFIPLRVIDPTPPAIVVGAVETVTWNGPVALGTNRSAIQIDGNDELILNGVVSGQGFNKYGEGILELAGTASNTNIIQSILWQGTVELNKSVGINALATLANIIQVGDYVGGDNADRLVSVASDQIPATSTITINGSGVWNLNDRDESFGAYAGATTAITLNQGPNGSPDINMTTGTLTLVNSATVANVANIATGTLAGGYQAPATISGGTLVIDQSATTASANTTITVADSTGLEDLVITSTIASAGGDLAAERTLNKAGNGRLVLAGNNTFDGSFAHSAGELVVRHNNAFGAPTGITILGNSTLILEDPVAGAPGLVIAEPFQSNAGGAGFGSRGQIFNAIGDNQLTGTLTLNGNSRIGVEGGTELDVNGQIVEIGGARTLDKFLTGTLEFSGTGANTYTGQTQVHEGDLILNKTGVVAITGNLVLGNNAGNDNSGLVTVAQQGAANGQIAETSVITVGTEGLLNLNGFNQTLNPAAAATSISMQFGNRFAADIATGAGVLTMGANANLVNADGAGFENFFSASPTISGFLNLANADLNVSATFDHAVIPHDLTISATINGGGATGTITKAGAGTLVLSGDNSAAYSGTTTLSAGTLLAGHNSALGTGSLNINGATSLGAVGNITLGNAITLGAAPVLRGTETDSLNLSGLITQTGATRTITRNAASGAAFELSGGVELGGFALVYDNQNFGTEDEIGNGAAAGGAITGAAAGSGLTKTGVGGLLLSDANSYIGTTTVSVGVLRISNALALGTPAAGTTVANGAQLALEGNITVAGEALTLTGLSNNTSFASNSGFGARGHVRNLSGTNTWQGNVTLQGSANLTQATAVTLGVDAGSELIIDGAITHIAGFTSTIGAFKVGAGTLEYTGAANTYTGTTTIQEGTLELNKAVGVNNFAGGLTVGDHGGGSNADQVRVLASNQIIDAAALTINSSGRLELDAAVDESITGAHIITRTYGAGGVLAAGDGASTYTLGNNVAVNNFGFTDGTATTGAANFTSAGGDVAMGATRTFTVEDSLIPDSAADLNLDAFFTGAGGLTTAGIGTTRLTADNSFTGAVLVQGTFRANAGTTSVVGGTLEITSGGDISSVLAITVQNGGTLRLLNTSVAGNLIGNTATINLAGGNLEFFGLAAGGFTEEVGVVTINPPTVANLSSRGSRILLDQNGATSDTELNLAGLVRNAGGVLAIETIDADLSDDSGANDLLLTLDAAPVFVGGILPWATVTGPAGFDLVRDFDGGAPIALGRVVAYDPITTLNGNVKLTADDNTLAGANTINALLVDGNGVDLDLNGFTLTVGTAAPSGLIATRGSTQTISDGTLNFGAREALFLTGTAGTDSLSVLADILGAAALRKESPGTLTFSGDNIGFTSTITVNQGTLVAASNNALGDNDATPGGAVTVNNLGRLVLDGGALGIDLGNKSIVLHGTGLEGDALGALQSMGAGAVTVGSGTTTITFNTTPIRIAVNGGDLTLNGTIGTGTNSLDKIGLGRLTLSGTANNTYTGTTTVLDGTLRLDKTGAAVVALAGALTIGDQSGNDTVELGGTTATTNLIADAAVITINGGTLNFLNTVLGGGTETTTGAFAINGGTVNSNDDTFGLSGSLTYNLGFGPAVINGNLNLGGAARTFAVNEGATLNDVTVNSLISNGSITKSNLAGGLLLTNGGNTFAGGVILQGGILALGHEDALGTGSLTVNTASSRLLADGLNLTGANAINNTVLFNLPSDSGLTLGGRRDFGGTNGIEFSGTVTMPAPGAGTRNFINVEDPQIDAEVSGIIDGGNNNFVFGKGGIGTLVLSGNNTFDVRDTLGSLTNLDQTEGISLNFGVLRITNSNALGGGAFSNVNVRGDQGAVLEIDGSLADVDLTNRHLIVFSPDNGVSRGFLNMTSTAGVHTGVVRSIAGDNTVTGQIDLRNIAGTVANAGTNFVDVVSDSLELIGQIVQTVNAAGTATATGARNITKTGEGALRFSGATANLYSGTTSIMDGRLELNKTAGVNAISGILQIGDNEGINDSAEVRFVVSDQLGSVTNINLGVEGLLNLNGQSEIVGTATALTVGPTFSSDITTGAGLLQLIGDVSVTPRPGIITSVASTITGSLQLTNVAGAALQRTYTVNDAPGEVELVISAVVSEFAGGPAGFIKAGAGRMVLSGDNTFSGNNNVNAGVLRVEHADALGDSGAATTTTVAAGASLEMNIVGSQTIDNEILSITGSGIINGPTTALLTTVLGTGGLRVLDGTHTFSQNVSLGANTLINVNDGDELILSGAGILAAGGNNIVKSGEGTWEIGGSAANTGTGTWFVNDGTVELNKAGAAVAIPTTLRIGDLIGVNDSAEVNYVTGAGTNQIGDVAISVQRDGLLDLNGISDTISNSIVLDIGPDFSGDVVTGAGTLSNAAATGTWMFSISNAGTESSSVASIVSGNLNLGTVLRTFDARESNAPVELDIQAVIAATAGSFTKVSRGTAALSGANLYTGATTVAADSGTLLVNGSTVAASAFTLTGSTVPGSTLGGTGTIGGAVTANNGTTINPGLNTSDLTGTLTITGALTFANGSTFFVDIDGPAAVDYDRINAGGTVVFSAAPAGALLAGNVDSAVTNTNSFLLINKTSGGAIGAPGFLNALPQPVGTTTVGGKSFSYNYADSVLGDGNDFVLNASAALRIWDGGSLIDDLWTTPENWVGDVTPFAGDNLLFPEGINEAQRINYLATGGTFTIAFGANTTAAIAFNATPAAVAVALNALASINAGGGSVTVTGEAGNYTITFSGGPLAGVNQPQVVLNTTSLTGLVGVTTVTTVANGAGAVTRLTPDNNFAANTPFGTIEINTSTVSYDLINNAVLLEALGGGILNAGTNTISLPLNLRTNPQTITAQTSGTLTFGATADIDLDYLGNPGGDLSILGTRPIIFNGTIDGSETVTINGTTANADYTFNDNVGGSDNLDDFLITTASDVIFNGNVSAADDFIQTTGTGETSFSGTGTSLMGGEIQIATVTITFEDIGTLQAISNVSLNLLGGGNATQASTHTLQGVTLDLQGTGNYTLASATNQFVNISGSVNGTIDYRDIDSLNILPAGLSTQDSDVRLQTGGVLTINGSINLNSDADLVRGDLGLISDGNVTQSAGSITASGLWLTFQPGVPIGTANFNLEQSLNDFDTFASNTEGTVAVVDADDFIVGSVDVLGQIVAGVTAAVDVQLQAGTDIHVDAAVNIGAGDLTLQAQGLVDQLASIMATGLRLLGAANFTLNLANAVTTIAANVTGTVEYTDTDALIVGSVTDTSVTPNETTIGITSTADVALHSAGLTINSAVATGVADFRIDSSAAVTQTAAITGTGLQLTGAGPFTLTNPGNNVATLAADTTEVVNYVDSSALAVGTVIVNGNSVTGITTTGDAVTINTVGLLSVNATISTLPGGPVAPVVGGNVALNAALVPGAGLITLNPGVAGSLVIAFNQTLPSINWSVTENIIVDAVLTTTVGGISLTADSDLNGTGGLLVTGLLGSLDSNTDVTLSAGDFVADAFVPVPYAAAYIAGDFSIVIENDAGVKTEILASGLVSIIANASVPTSDIQIDGQILNDGATTTITSRDDIALDAASSITNSNVAGVTSLTAGASALVSGDINGDGAGSGLITSFTVDLNADNGIGDVTVPIQTVATNISADNTGTGAVYIVNTLATASVATTLTTDTGDVAFLQQGGGALTVQTATTVTDGDIFIVVDSADLNAGTVAITANGTGNVELDTLTSGNITLGEITALGDDVTANAADAILDNTAAGTDVSSDTATFVANNGSIGAVGGGNEIDTTITTLTFAHSTNGSIAIVEADGLTVTAAFADGTGVNNVDITSTTGDILVGAITAEDTVTLLATTGSILDEVLAGDTAVDITATAANLTAANQIGAPGVGFELDTDIDSLTATQTGTGATPGIWLTDEDALIVTSATTNDGVVFIDAARTSAGNLTATSVTAAGASRNVRLRTLTATSDILLGLVTAAFDTVGIDALGEIIDNNGAGNNVAAFNLVMFTTDGIGNGGVGNDIDTTVTNLAAEGGSSTDDNDVRVTNTGTLTLNHPSIFLPAFPPGIGLLPAGVAVRGDGSAEIVALSPHIVAANVVMGGSVILTAADDVAAGDILTVNGGITVQSLTSTVTLNAGDGVTLNGGPASLIDGFSGVAINVDNIGGLGEGAGSASTLAGTIQTTDGNITITSGAGGDTFTQTGSLVAGITGDITISLGAGADQFNAATTATAVLTASLNTITINGGDGNDTILLGDQNFAATISAANTILNGNDGTNNPDGSDTFKVRASAFTPFTIDGDDPTEPTLPGDTLFVDLTGVSGPVNESHGDPNTTISFPNPPNSQLDITYREIETRQTTGLGSPLVNHIFDLLNYPLVADGVFDVQLTSDSNLKVTLNGASVYNGDDATVNSLTFAGNAGNDAVRIHALAGTGELPSEGGLVDFGLDGVNTLPGVTPTGISSMDATRKAVSGAFAANARTPVSLSNNRAGVYFDGRGGTNSIVLDVTTARDVAYLSDSQAGFGANQGDLSVQAAGGTLRGFAASFANVNSVHLREQTAVGSKLLIDASSTSATTTISVVDILDPVTTSQYDALNPVNNSLVVNPNVTFTGASQLVGNGGVAATRFANFADVTIRSGGYTGASVGETLDLISLDPLGLTTLALDAGSALGTGAGPGADSGAADTIQLRSLPSGVTATLTGGLGSDTFRLHGETTIVVDNDPPTDYTNVPGSDGLDANDTVDNIAGPVVVDGEDANLANNNDQLFIIDSGDTTADPNVLIAAAGGMNADYAVTGINASGVTFRNIDSFDYTGTQGGDTIDGRFTPTNVPHDLNTVALRGFDGDDQFLLFTSNQWGGVTPVTELPFTRVASGVGTISLYGNDGEDIFGETPAPVIGNTGAMHVGLAVPATTRLIRPTTAATAGGSTIFIDGGDPVPALNQAGDTVGDVLNLDVTDVPKNTAMIVGAGSSGNVLSANTAPFSWVSIEDLNLVDNGKLTGVQIGDVFGRGTTGNDLMQISANATAALPHQVRVRIGGAIMNYNVPGKAVLYGGNGVDTMSQTTAKIPAVFYGEAGNDSLAGGSNNDWLVGGDGNDQITGGEGQNVIWGDNAPTNPGDPTPQDFQGPNDGNDSISSGNGADVIYAGGGHDVVNSGGGNDYIHAGAGNDSVDAGAGDDRVYGYSGNDTLQGNSGNDLLSGGDGNDWLLGHSGNNVLIGGTGSDTLSGGDGNDLLITGGLGGEENSTWTSAPNTMTYAANTYSDPMDNDAALLALLTAWQGNSNAAAPPPEVLALLPIIAPDGSDDDAWGGNGSDLFSWDAADMADESLTAPGPNDFNNPATGPDVRLI